MSSGVGYLVHGAGSPGNGGSLGIDVGHPTVTDGMWGKKCGVTFEDQ